MAKEKKKMVVVAKESVRVVALRAGFYGNARRKPGAVFEVQIGADEDLPSWVDFADDAPAKPASSRKSPSEGEESGSSDNDVI